MTFFVVNLLFILLYSYLVTKNSFHMLQQNNYDKDFRYIKWVNKNYRKILHNFGISNLLFSFVLLASAFIKDNILVNIISISLFLLIFLIENNKYKKIEHKKSLVITSRIKRLMFTNYLIYIIPLIFIIKDFNIYYLFMYYFIYFILINFQYVITFIIVKINYPIERIVFYYYRSKAKKKLKSMINLKVIGITGSYGKTSSKNILNEILSIKFNTLPTPQNFNTPYGLIRTINENMDKFDEIFIAEMGAYRPGEIKELCNLVHPKYGILTKIGTAHLELFGSQENILNTKFELIESLPEDGIGILNADDKLQKDYKLKNNCKIIWIGIENDSDVRATNIKTSYKGTSFEVIFKGEKEKYKFETKLLGVHNVYNILAGIALGHEFGIKTTELIASVKHVKPVEHRLELKKFGNINIIDDAYNSNPVGSKMALDILSKMPGYKVIVTPGMIELGSEQYNSNKEFGKYMSKICDKIILVGESQTKPIQDGLEETKYNKKNIHIINDIKESFNIINKINEKDIYVLLENDLPDIFNEGKVK